jgi:hypothetical protein
MDRKEDSEGKAAGLLGPGFYMYFFSVVLKSYTAAEGKFTNTKLSLNLKSALLYS